MKIIIIPIDNKDSDFILSFKEKVPNRLEAFSRIKGPPLSPHLNGCGPDSESGLRVFLLPPGGLLFSVRETAKKIEFYRNSVNFALNPKIRSINAETYSEPSRSSATFRLQLRQRWAPRKSG